MDAVDDVQGIIRRVGDVQASIYPGDCRVIKSALPNGTDTLFPYTTLFRSLGGKSTYRRNRRLTGLLSPPC